MTILYFLILLSVIICIHEAGHLIAAKIFGVYCFEFSFGMGPLLLKHKSKETQYSLRLIPIGGYVAMAGETDAAGYEDVEVPEGRRLTDKPTWQRLIILLAGVTMNFILCYLILTMIVLYNGAFAIPPTSRIEAVMPDSPAERAGLQAGDRITAFTADGRTEKIDSFQDIETYLILLDQPQIEITVERNGETLVLPAELEYVEDQQSYRIGIQGESYQFVKVNLLNCWYYGAKEMAYFSQMMVAGIRSLLSGHNLNQVSGPVGIYSATEQSVSYGIIGYLILMAELSLNVGLMNLLPLPVLDGGQVVITLGEAIAHRKLNENVKIALMGACWVLLIGLMVFVTWNDIARLIG